MIDSHCHLADPAFAGDLEAVIARAREAGVERVLVILAAGDAAEAARATRVEHLWPAVRFAVGVHPHTAGGVENAGTRRPDEMVRDQFFATPGARAVGEIGLDYHYDFAPRTTQQMVFRAQVQLALAIDQPVVVHTREAESDTIDILRGEGGGQLRGVLHCFTGGPDLARAGLDLGLFISFAGILTFPRAADLRETARLVPLDRVLVETDSPFLAPVPHRGRRNEPAHVGRVVDALAEAHGVAREQVAECTRANFNALFRP